MRNPGDHQLLASQIHLEYLILADLKVTNSGCWNRRPKATELQRTLALPLIAGG
jgi:hypothetical protein